MQKQAIRIVFDAEPFTETEYLFKENGFMTLPQLLLYHRCILIFKVMNQLLPGYLFNMFTKCNIYGKTRSCKNGDVLVKTVTQEIGKKSFSYTGANTWNNLHMYLRNATCLSSFKQQCKNFIMETSF